MTTILPYNYADLPADDADALRAAAHRIRACMARTARDIIEVGRDLAMAKGRLPHGRFLSWAQAEFGIGRTMVSQFVNVAERLGPKCSTVEHLPPTVLYALASPSVSDESRTCIIEAAAQGQSVSLSDIRVLKRAGRSADDNKSGCGSRASDKDLLASRCSDGSLEGIYTLVTSSGDEVVKELLSAVLRSVSQGIRDWLREELEGAAAAPSAQDVEEQPPARQDSAAAAEVDDCRVDLGIASDGGRTTGGHHSDPLRIPLFPYSRPSHQRSH